MEDIIVNKQLIIAKARERKNPFAILVTLRSHFFVKIEYFVLKLCYD